MALASCNVSIISRGKGHSIVAAAAYRSAQKLHSAYDGRTHDYTRKSGVIYSEILTPAGAPSWAQNREQLCNLIEQSERRKDARLARSVMIALPRELTDDQNIALARAYAQTFVQQGMIADLSIHDSHDSGVRNPHAHILLTCRVLEGDHFGKKCREWDSVEQLVTWRKRYEDITNQHLKLAGHDVRIDVRSYEAQGIDRIPGVHMGPYAHRLEQQGFYSELGVRNREIDEKNRQLEKITVELKKAYQLRDELEQEEEQEHIERRNFDIEQAYTEKTLKQAKQPTPEPSVPPVLPLPESGPPSSEPEILRQRKLALEQERRGKDDGNRGSSYAYAPQHSGGRILAQQRRAAQQLQEQEQQKVENREPQHHKRGNISQQRKIALGHKNKDPVSEVYKEGHHEYGNNVQRKPHHNSERGRQYIKRHDKKLYP